MRQILQKVNNSREGLFTSAFEDMRSDKIGRIHTATEKYSLKYQTLRDCKRGLANPIGCHENQQHLTNAEEKAIVAWIGQVNDYGWPPKLD